MTEVWVLTISHKYDTSIYVFATEDLLRQALYEWVVEWWGVEIGEEAKMPEDHDKAIRAYFDIMADRGNKLEILLSEYYEYDAYRVEGA